MKHLIILFLFLIPLKNGFAQVMWQVKDMTSQKWYLEFCDEFDGEDLDDTKWKSGLPWGNAQYFSDSYFLPENISLNNNTLKLSANNVPYPLKLTAWEIDSVWFKKNKKAIPEEYVFKYRTGCISTKRKFKNGYFEIRFKTQKVHGMWPAFWLYGGSPNEEIDFFEIKSKNEKQFHVDMHCPDGCDNFRGGFLNLHKGWGGWINADNGLNEGWNIISGQWEKDYVKLFLNGTPVAYFKGEFKTWQNLMIENGTERIGKPPAGPNETTLWPNKLEVDYVRVWSDEDTIYDIKDKYKLFENSPKTISDGNLYTSGVSKKLNLVYDKKALGHERGTITLLPVFYNKYSLSIAGKNLGKIQVDIIDRFDNKVAGFGIENTEYYIMDLSNLPTGPYKVKINLLNQILMHEVPVINPEKIGEQSR